jgi:hypothetical protein
LPTGGLGTTDHALLVLDGFLADLADFVAASADNLEIFGLLSRHILQVRIYETLLFLRDLKLFIMPLDRLIILNLQIVFL